MSEIILTKQLAPATPDAGKIVMYFKSDGRGYWKDENGLETPFKTVGAGTGDLMSDGSVALVADWDVGAFQITALRFHSDEPTLSPFTVVSNVLVTNLNADLLDGQHASEFASSTQGGTADSAVQPGDINSLANLNSYISELLATEGYVNNAVLGLLDPKGAYDASTNTPDLDTAPSGILKGDAYTVTVAGTFFTEDVQVGDWMYATQDDPTTLAHWVIIEGNLDPGAFQPSDTKLDDLVASFTGNAGKVPVINSGETAYAFEDFKPLESFVIAVTGHTTDLAAGTNKLSYRMPYAFEIEEVRGSLTTASTGQDVKVDINEGGASILSTVITIEIGETTSKSATVQPVVSDSSFADDAELIIDIDQAGTTTAGAGLKITVIGRRA